MKSPRQYCPATEDKAFMAISGRASDWADTFPDGFIPDILALVFSAWAQLKKPAMDDLEVPITRRFCAKLRQEKKLQTLPFTISRQTKIDDSGGIELGELDLCFTAGRREDVYFAFECKRLRIPYPNGCRPNNSEYVQEGMLRFIEAQYAHGLEQGGMIAYVMDGDTASAIMGVSTAIRRRQGDLKMVPGEGLLRSSIEPDREEARETRHHLQVRAFKMHHLFLAV